MKQYPDGTVPSGLLESEPPCALVEFVATSSKQVGFCQLNVRIGCSFDGHKQVIKCCFHLIFTWALTGRLFLLHDGCQLLARTAALVG